MAVKTRLDGGAVGWTGNVVINRLSQIGVYGAPITSSLVIPAGVQTNLLHLGGEFSSGVMTKSNLWTIADNAGTLAFMPVALVKSGINSTLDLSAGGQNTYTGGTSIIGGTIVVSSSNQLGGNVAQGIAPGPIMIANGGQLRITRQHDVHARPQRHDLRNAC